MEDPGADPPERRGLVLAERPRVSPIGLAASAGAVWGLLGYAVLWEGRPFLVDRPYVESVAGTLVLLPVRVVLWAIHLAEDAVGRPFDLSTNHAWIGLAAGLVGAAIVGGLALAARVGARRLRARRRGGSIAA